MLKSTKRTGGYTNYSIENHFLNALFDEFVLEFELIIPADTKRFSNVFMKLFLCYFA